jgi:hypothetical protein
MQAINLEQALRFFDPKKPLSGNQLNLWFVPRAESPRRRLEIFLRNQQQPSKVLFIGHRGSGKTTELNMLATELTDRFLTIGFSVLGTTGRTSPEYEDLMLAISTQVIRTCIDQRIVGQPLADPVRRGWEDLRAWWQQVVAGLEFRPVAAEQSIYAELNTLLGQVEVGARQSSVTRDHLRFQINQQMPELIQRLNWVIEQAEGDGSRRLLIVVEDLDKIDLKSATDIFRDHAPTIVAPQATMIFTFPLALRHSDHYNTIRLNFPAVHFLPNLAIQHADGSPNEEGIHTLKRLVDLRLKDELIDADALELLIHSNGGIPVWLIFLMRSAVLFALERDGDAKRITRQDVQKAVMELRREGIAPLTRHDLQVLRARHQDRRLSNDPDEQRLLYNGSLIEYFNDAQWCDAHPALWSLLEEDH